jgi:hypothetical protein
MRLIAICLALAVVSYGYIPDRKKGENLRVEQDQGAGTISVFRSDGKEPIVTHNAKRDFRPYLHPIVAPDGKGVLTEYSPAHHKWQMGVYWGFTVLNGRDYFRNWLGEHWRRISADVIVRKGRQVRWQTVYDWLDEKGSAILRETQNWTMEERGGKYLLDLEWRGEANSNLVVGKYYAGGLFVRMPWHQGIPGEIVNAVGQRNQAAEGQRAIWADVGIQVEGRNDLAHIAIFDHPDNNAFPTPWRADDQLGMGPSRAILGDWKIDKGRTEVVRNKLVVYTGDMNTVELNHLWKEFACAAH